LNIDLELYKVFYNVAKCRNISMAAESLYISQPAVSKSIRKLEDIIGIELFSRNSRGVSLTTEGKVFFNYVEKAMKELDMGEKVLEKLKKVEKGEISIGVSITLCKYFLIPVLKSFINSYPMIQIKIMNNTTYDTLKLVEEGKIDFGIISKPFDVMPYDFIDLREIEDIFVASREYLLGLGAKDTKEIFTKGTLMLLERNNITRKYVDKYFEENDIELKPDIEINNMDFLIEFAKIGLGVATVIKDFIKKELEDGELVQIPVYPAIPKRIIGIVSNKNIPLSIASESFISFLKHKIS
jgi:DNA-binding transcriptional LysR family regulator